MIGRIPPDTKREREESPVLDDEEPIVLGDEPVIGKRVKVEKAVVAEEPWNIVDGVIVIDG